MEQRECPPPRSPPCLLCLRIISLLHLTAIKLERFKYCLKGKAKYLSMSLQVLPVCCWAFINAGTIWVPNTCAQNVSFWLQTGFHAVSVGDSTRQEGGGEPHQRRRTKMPSPPLALHPGDSKALRKWQPRETWLVTQVQPPPSPTPPPWPLPWPSYL